MKTRGDITTDTAGIQKITRDYYEQLHTNKLDNPERMTAIESYPWTSQIEISPFQRDYKLN